MQPVHLSLLQDVALTTVGTAIPGFMSMAMKLLSTVSCQNSQNCQSPLAQVCRTASTYNSGYNFSGSCYGLMNFLTGISPTDVLPPIQCDVEGQVYSECTCGCGRSCDLPSYAQLSCSCHSPSCFPGCECPAGTLLDRVQNKCVSSREECG